MHNLKFEKYDSKGRNIQKFSLQTRNLKESHQVISERIRQNTHPDVFEALSVMFDKCKKKKQKPLLFSVEHHGINFHSKTSIIDIYRKYFIFKFANISLTD